MEKCMACQQEMTTADGCKCSHVIHKGKKYERIKVGDCDDFFSEADRNTRCDDCGAKTGHYHHLGCDCVCGMQLYSCDCNIGEFI